MTIHPKVAEQYIPVVLLIELYNVPRARTALILQMKSKSVTIQDTRLLGAVSSGLFFS